METPLENLSLEELLDFIRTNGWSVAVHNDYKQPEYALTTDADTHEPISCRIGETPRTFWLFTHPTGIWIKGEGPTDKQAVLICAKAAMEFAGDLEETPAGWEIIASR